MTNAQKTIAETYRPKVSQHTRYKNGRVTLTDAQKAIAETYRPRANPNAASYAQTLQKAFVEQDAVLAKNQLARKAQSQQIQPPTAPEDTPRQWATPSPEVTQRFSSPYERLLGGTPQQETKPRTVEEIQAEIGRRKRRLAEAESTLAYITGNPDSTREQIQAAQEDYDAAEAQYKATNPLRFGESLELAAAVNLGGLLAPVENISDTILGGAAELGASLFREGKALLSATIPGVSAESKAAKWLEKQAQTVYETDGMGGLNNWLAGIAAKYDTRVSDRDKKTQDLVQAGDNMLMCLALGSAFSAAAGAGGAGQAAETASKAAFGLSAAGGSTKEALAEGADVSSAVAYGTLMGAMETATEALSGGIPGMGKGKVTGAILKAMHKLDDTGALRFALETLGEGGEEVISTFAAPYIQRMLYNPKAENATLRELGEAFSGGVVLSLLMQGGHYVAERASNAMDRALHRGGQAAVADWYGTEAQKPIDRPWPGDDGVFSGQNTTASTEAAESTAVNTDPAQHTPAEQAVIDAYQAAVDEDIITFYKEAKENQNAGSIRLNDVSDRAANDIMALTGHNTSGFKTTFDARQAWHINNDHGIEGKSDHSMADDNDVGRIQYVLDNYDHAEYGGTTDAYWEPKENGRSRQAPVVVFSKKVNGTYYVVEATPVSKARSVNIVSAYMLESGKTPPGRSGKKKTGESSQLPDANASWFTAKTDSANTSPVNPSIAQNGSGVNGEHTQTGTGNTLRPVEDVIADLLGVEVQPETVSDRDAEHVYQKWSKEIGVNPPIESLAEYYNMEYNNPPRYRLLQGYARVVLKGDISPLVGFDLYEQIGSEIENKFVGITTKTGVAIDDFATHFIDRVIGQSSMPHPGMRCGVPMDEALDTLLNPIREGEIRYCEDGDIRQTLYGKTAAVTVSIRDGRIIQTNPRGGR